MPVKVAPNELWTRAQAREADAHATGALAAPSAVLMERVAVAVADIVDARWPSRRVLDVYAGPGNNGADGIAVARILAQRGWAAQVLLATARGSEARAAQRARAAAAGVTLSTVLRGPRPGAVVVDALLGTGSRGAPQPELEAAIRALDGYPDVAAIDLPSGVDPDDGVIEGAVVRAAVTVTVERSKPGLHLTPGRDAAGEVVVARVGIERPPDAPASPFKLIGAQTVRGDRREGPSIGSLAAGAAHKGARGHVGLWAGSERTPGAAALAASASLRMGAGLVTARLPTRAGAEVLVAARPEVMLDGVGDEVAPGANALVVGPGLLDAAGMLTDPLRRCWAEDLRPAVWDASALLVLGDATGARRASHRGPRIVTPHPGEAATLLSKLESRPITAEEVQRARLASARSLAIMLDAVVVLKGRGSLVAAPTGEVWIATEGSSALATAGTGDVLSGVVGTLLAQGVAAARAARVAVLVHAVAGELAAHDGTAVDGMPTASEVADRLGAAVAGLEGAAPDPLLANFPRQRWG